MISIHNSGGNIESLYLKALYRRAQAYISLHRYDEALLDLDDLLNNADESNPAASALKTELIKLMNDDDHSSKAENTSGVDLEMNIIKMKEKALAYLSNGSSHDAILVLKDAIDLIEKNKNNGDDFLKGDDLYITLLLLQGKAHSSLNKHQEAIESFDKILRKSSKHFKALLRRSESYLRLVNYYLHLIIQKKL